VPKAALTSEGDGKAVAPEAADLVPRRADLLIEYIAGAAQSFDAYARSLPPWQDLLTRDFPDVYERMLLDPVVHASTRVIKLNVLADDITPRPAVDDADKPDFELAKTLADFCADAQGGMKRALEDVWYEHLDGVFVGHRLSEKVIRTQDSGPHAGKSVWDRINPKPQDNYRFVLDPFGNLVGLVTRPPGGDWGPLGSGLVDRDHPNLLPREKFALLTWDPRNGDPRGRALLRHCYEPWWHKQQALAQWLKFLAQTAVPSLFATTPQGAGVLPPQDALGNPTGAQALSPGQQLLNQLVAFQGGTAMVAAAGTLLQVIQAAGDGSVFSRRIDYADSCIAREITLQTLAIIEAKHGTRSQGEVHQDVMDLGVDYIRRLSCRVIREDVYRPLIRYNWGDDAADRLCPFASMTAVAKQDLNTTLPAYASVGYQLAPDQLPAVDEELGLPVRKEQPPEQQQPPPGDGNPPGNPPDGNQPPGGADQGLSKSTVPPDTTAPFYSPEQEREPAGSPGGGQWTAGGGGGTGSPPDPHDPRVRKLVSAARRKQQEAINQGVWAVRYYDEVLAALPPGLDELRARIRQLQVRARTERWPGAVEEARQVTNLGYRLGVSSEVFGKLSAGMGAFVKARDAAKQAEGYLRKAYRLRRRSRQAGGSPPPSLPFSADQGLSKSTVPDGSAPFTELTGGRWVTIEGEHVYIKGDNVVAGPPAPKALDLSRQGKAGADGKSALPAAEDYRQNGTRAKAFKAWFGDWEHDPANASKVVDQQTGEPKETHGEEPKVVYHGRQATFESFDISRAKSVAAGLGAYFAEDRRIADTFATMGGKKGDVLTAYLSIKKPFNFDAPIPAAEVESWSRVTKEMPGTGPKYFTATVRAYQRRDGNPDGTMPGHVAWRALKDAVGDQQANKVLERLGYDGIVHTSSDEAGAQRIKTDEPDFGRVWVAFRPTQIKAVDNAGTFDPSDPRVAFGLSESTVPPTPTGPPRD
jgi:hypothetical protein